MSRKSAALLCVVLAFAVGCKKSKPPSSNKPNASVAAESCPDLEAQSALMRCNGNNLEYCSSFSRFKWTEAQQCPGDKLCFVAPDGKGGGCR